MSEIIDKTREFFYKRISDYGSDPYTLIPHLPEVEKWANFMIKKYPDADKEVVLLGVWLHDIGHYPILDADHAVSGEKIAREFLQEQKLSEDKIEKVLHCVRSHRCKDCLPETVEARIVAFSDSASHMTQGIYYDMIKAETRETVLSKIDRDYWDLAYFPEIKEQMKEIYEAWKNLINAYVKLNFK